MFTVIPKDQLNLSKAIIDAQNAKNYLQSSWYHCRFARLLKENLKDLVRPFPREWPRLRCYRGTGVSCEINYAIYHNSDNIFTISIYTDLIRSDISEMEESEGCPGAPIKRIKMNLLVPPLILDERVTIKNFKNWIKTEQKRLLKYRREEVKELLKERGIEL